MDDLIDEIHTNEEKFIEMALNSKQDYARAKLIIMNLIESISKGKK